jgi:hypothetical protein
MNGMLMWIGRLVGLLGVGLSVVAIAARLVGSYQLGNFQALTVLEAGTAAMVMGCLAYIASLAERNSGRL